MSEKINLLTPEQITGFLAVKYPAVYLEMAQRYEKGEVVVDSRGRGTMQRV